MTLWEFENNGCPSTRLLDSLVLDELTKEESRAVSTHCHSCPHCRERLSEIQQHRDAFLRALAKHAFVSKRPWRTLVHWTRPAFGASFAAVAALIVLVAFLDKDTIWRKRDGVQISTFETRRKGGDHLRFFVRGATGTRQGFDDMNVSPGDTIQFRYWSTETTYFVLAGQDEQTNPLIFFPSPGSDGRLPAGAAVELPFDLTLDDTPGVEHFVGAFCPSALERQRAQENIRRDLSSFVAPPTCTQVGFRLEKVP